MKKKYPLGPNPSVEELQELLKASECTWHDILQRNNSTIRIHRFRFYLRVGHYMGRLAIAIIAKRKYVLVRFLPKHNGSEFLWTKEEGVVLDASEIPPGGYLPRHLWKNLDSYDIDEHKPIIGGDYGQNGSSEDVAGDKK